jgi:hypothetical protein
MPRLLALSTKWRRRLTLAILAIACRMRPGRLPIVDRLQRIAKKRQDYARSVVDAVKSSPYSLKYLGLSLVELFPSELRHEVEDGARALFPSLKSNREPMNPNVMRSKNFGRLYRTRPTGFVLPPNSYALLGTLPPWVEFVDVGISQIYPSSFIVSANVVTNELVDAVIYERIKTETPGAIELNRLGRLSHLGFSYATYPAEQAFAAEFQALLSRLRSDVRHAVFERLMPRGYFLTHERELPAIELMQVIGGESFPPNDWISATSEWRGALGLMIDRDYYEGEDIVISTGGGIEQSFPPVWRIVCRPEYNGALHGNRDHSRADIAKQIQDRLDDTLHSLSIAAHQDIVSALVARFHRRVLLSRRRPLNIPAQAKLYEDILNERMFYRRLKHDFEDEHLNAGSNELLHALHYQTVFLPKLLKDKAGDVNLRERLEWGYKRLTTGIDEVRAFYSDLLPARNHRAANLLARAALTVAALSFLNAVTVGVVKFAALPAPQSSISPVATAHPVLQRLHGSAAPIPSKRRHSIQGLTGPSKPSCKDFNIDSVIRPNSLRVPGICVCVLTDRPSRRCGTESRSSRPR